MRKKKKLAKKGLDEILENELTFLSDDGVANLLKLSYRDMMRATTIEVAGNLSNRYIMLHLLIEQRRTNDFLKELLSRV